MVRLVIAIGLT